MKKSFRGLKINENRSASNKSTCNVCTEEKQLVNISKRCTHAPDSCLECTKQSVRTEIQSKGATRIACSSRNCNVKYQAEEYYPLLDKKLQGITDKLLLNILLEQDDEFRWCKSSKGCGSGQLISNHRDLTGYYTCHSCGTMMCYRHSMEWHTGFTCEEFEAEKAKNPDFATESEVRAYSKNCPNENCKTAIMKHEGCDVISCCRYGTHDCNDQKGKCDHGGRPYCGQKFCWKCLGKIDVDYNTGAYTRHCKQTCDYSSLN